jgi:hypothetical protein
MSNPLALHTSTLDTTQLAEVQRVARDTGWDAVELRRVDFDRAEAAGQSEQEVLELVRHSQLSVSAVGVAAGWMFAVGDAVLLDTWPSPAFCSNRRATSVQTMTDDDSAYSAAFCVGQSPQGSRHRRTACGPCSATLTRASRLRTFWSRVPRNIRNAVAEPSGRLTSRGGHPATGNKPRSDGKMSGTALSGRPHLECEHRARFAVCPSAASR